MSNQTDKAAKEMRNIKMLEKLENYIFGKLNQEEIDALWIIVMWLFYVWIFSDSRFWKRESFKIFCK